MFREFGGWKFWNFLSITVFCEVKATKHCNAQISMLKKFQNFREYGPGPDIDARISEFLEHYRVS